MIYSLVIYKNEGSLPALVETLNALTRDPEAIVISIGFGSHLVVAAAAPRASS